MKRTRLLILGVACVAVPIALSACKRAETPPPPPPAAARPRRPAPAPAPFRVSSVDVGNAIGADKRVTSPSATLAPSDTIYASVASTGAAPSVKLVARWTYGDEGQLVSEQSQMIAPTGPANSEFHISKPDGWPAGNYKVEILADGASGRLEDLRGQVARCVNRRVAGSLEFGDRRDHFPAEDPQRRRSRARPGSCR